MSSRLPAPLRPVVSSARAVVERVTSHKLSGDRLLLEIDLTRGLVEAPPSSPIDALRSMQTPTLRGLVDALERAAEDDDVVGVIAHIGDVGFTAAAELRTAVAAFRAADKRAVAWAESYGEMAGGNAAYHLATAFDEVWLQTTGQVGLVGVAAQATFLRGTLDKLGVQAQIGQRYEYKSAADRFTEREMTEPVREMMTRIVGSLTQTLIDDIAESRGLDPADVRTALDDGPLKAAQALERGLVDRLGYRDDVYAALRADLEGADAQPEVTLRYADRYGRPSGPLAGLLEQLPQPSKGKGVIAIVGAYGPIHLGRNGGAAPIGGASIGSDSLSAALRSAGKDDNVRAIVLRIDSPGGSAVASDAVRNTIQQVRAGGTPVVASMGAVAGSGGYFIAMPCDRILAGAGTLTGSIGVLAGKQVITDALGKIGIDRETVSDGRHADMFSVDRPFDDDEWQRIEGWLDDVYVDFTTKAAQDRGMELGDLQALARGRVWTGADAAASGLVDSVGGLSDAIDVACGIAGTDRADVEARAWPKPNPLAAFSAPQSSEAPAAALLRAPSAGPVLGLGEGDAVIDRVLHLLSAYAGMPVHGALTMPWRIRLR